MAKAYKELEFPKGSVSSVLATMNSAVNPPAKKKPNANGTKKKTGTTSQKTTKK